MLGSVSSEQTAHLTLTTVGMLLCLLGVAVTSVAAGSREYCHLEAFRASCNAGEVILMKSAWYGRITLGRCLTRDYFVGCKADVLTHMDERCSGRQECEVKIPDPTMFKAQPCPKDLVAYLEADFSCVKVLADPQDKSRCRNQHRLETRAPSGYLSSLVADTQGLGTSDCPWVIRAKPGQQVRLVLMDFSDGTEDRIGQGSVIKGQGSNMCRVYANVHENNEGHASKEHVVCSGLKRETTVYTSKSNVATVQIQTHDHSVGGPDEEEMGKPQFLIRYEAVGCPDPRLPPSAWSQRDGDKLDVKCNRTRGSWHLVCKGTDWVGDIGKCDSDSPWNDEHSVPKDRLLHFPNGILIAVMIGVALGIFLGFVLLSVIIMQRRRRDKRRREAQAREENSLLGCGTDGYKLQQQPIYLERMDPDHILAVCPEHGTKVDMAVTSLPRGKPPFGMHYYESTKAEDKQQQQQQQQQQAQQQPHQQPHQQPQQEQQYYREFAPCIDVDLTKPARTLTKPAPPMRTNLDITDVC